jgi:outer membrane protein assembly factor BamB
MKKWNGWQHAAPRWAIICGVAYSCIVPNQIPAQGTKVWTISRYDEMERGTTDGVAIRSDGALEPGPATSLLYQSGGNYIWSIASDAAGNTYAGMGGIATGGAVVMRIAADGKATKVFTGKELGVQALRIGPDGKVYAATSPEGKVYRLGASESDAAIVFDAATTIETPKYLWDLAIDSRGDLYIAVGAPAIVYRVPAGTAKPEVLFKTADQHIRCLLLAADGTLWAGSDGSGVIYRFDTRTPGAKPLAAYSAAKKEITSLAMDGKGNIYAAGVGTRPSPGTPSPGLPPLPVTGAVGVTINFSQAGSTNAATQNTLIPEGSEIYRIAADGSPQRLLALKEDIVYALAFHNGELLAATGNRGRIYRIDTHSPGVFADIAHLEAAQATALSADEAGVLAATSNSGKVYRLADKPASDATYTSEVFDAQGFSQWGRVELLPDPATNFDLYARTGNVESPLIGWSEWTPVARSGAVTLPGGRYAQWKALLHTGSELQSIGLNYLQKNLAPVVDDVVVVTGARIASTPPQTQNQTVQIAFPSPAAGGMQGFVPDTNAQPLTAQKDRTAVTIRWAAHDDNGDDLTYSAWYRGIAEKNWRLLKDRVNEKFLSFDASLLPDGRYVARVIASDAPSHTDAEALTGDRASGEFIVDTTPPVPGTLTATLLSATAGAPARIHATFDARDATSSIAHAEYSIDAGPWQYLEPVGRVSDSLEERYDFTAPIPALTGDAASGVVSPAEHVIAVRVYDRYENVVSIKAVVR